MMYIWSFIKKIFSMFSKKKHPNKNGRRYSRELVMKAAAQSDIVSDIAYSNISWEGECDHPTK